jgi:hypothetical protein
MKIPSERSGRVLLKFLAAAVFLAPAMAFAADNFPQKTSKQKELPDNLMQWMAERYDAKTMLGFDWKNPGKAKVHYAFERNSSWRKAGFLGGSAARRGPGARLDIMPLASFIDYDAADIVTNSYIEVKYTGPGRGVSWNVGYLKYSETRNDWIFDYSYTGAASDSVDGDKYRKTDASVLFASLVLTLPAQNLSWYAYGGPAVASYDYSESGVYSTSHYDYTTFTLTTGSGVYGAKKSGTAATWIAGVGASLRLSDSGFGLFGEYKHMPETGYFAGLDNLGLGVSFGF